jgi:type IV secretory pathway VirJ component
VDDLPLVEVPTSAPGDRFAILLTGDGGWAGIDRGIAAAFAEAGVPVVGLDATKYFWNRRTPEETAAAVARIARHYRAAWKRGDVLLVGYSRGAELVAFLPPRMAEDARAAVKAVVMIGPGTWTEFEVHAIDVLWAPKREAALPTRPAAEALGALPVVCVQGTDEDDSLCPEIASRPSVRRLVLSGGHHFGGEYGKVAGAILGALRR